MVLMVTNRVPPSPTGLSYTHVPSPSLYPALTHGEPFHSPETTSILRVSEEMLYFRKFTMSWS